MHQENNHLRQLLELADSDGAMSVLPQENSASVMAQLGMDKNGAKEPLDGRGRASEILLPPPFSPPDLGALLKSHYSLLHFSANIIPSFFGQGKIF